MWNCAKKLHHKIKGENKVEEFVFVQSPGAEIAGDMEGFNGGN
jgi:hypothetical protein